MKLPVLAATDRIAFIEKYARGKRVLHVGCADMPFTRDGLRSGTLLHQRLHGQAAKLVGVDLSAEGIGMMRAAGFDDLYVANCEEPLSAVVPGRYDVVVAGETLEHVQNAGEFLASLREVCAPSGSLVITVPNHASLKMQARLLARVELVHPEHVAYYSVSTLSRLFALGGLEATEWAVYWAKSSAKARLANAILARISRLQYFADGLCVACRPAG